MEKANIMLKLLKILKDIELTAEFYIGVKLIPHVTVICPMSAVTTI